LAALENSDFKDSSTLKVNVASLIARPYVLHDKCMVAHCLVR